jgi:hypothetical protein
MHRRLILNGPLTMLWSKNAEGGLFRCKTDRISELKLRRLGPTRLGKCQAGQTRCLPLDFAKRSHFLSRCFVPGFHSAMRMNGSFAKRSHIRGGLAYPRGSVSGLARCHGEETLTRASGERGAAADKIRPNSRKQGHGDFCNVCDRPNGLASRK